MPSVESNAHHKIKNSKSQKLVKLSSKEAEEGKQVYERVRKHLKQEANCHDFFKHLSGEESIDHALVSFLKTKIQRAEAAMK
jgi:hypothetical protein